MQAYRVMGMITKHRARATTQILESPRESFQSGREMVSAAQQVSLETTQTASNAYYLAVLSAHPRKRNGEHLVRRFIYSVIWCARPIAPESARNSSRIYLPQCKPTMKHCLRSIVILVPVTMHSTLCERNKSMEGPGCAEAVMTAIAISIFC